MASLWSAEQVVRVEVMADSSPSATSSSFTYRPISPYLFSYPSNRSARSQISVHGFIVSGNEFDHELIKSSWHKLVDLWPVLAAHLVTGDKVPSSSASTGAADRAKSTWSHSKRTIYLQIPNQAEIQKQREFQSHAIANFLDGGRIEHTAVSAQASAKGKPAGQYALPEVSTKKFTKEFLKQQRDARRARKAERTPSPEGVKPPFAPPEIKPSLWKRLFKNPPKTAATVPSANVKDIESPNVNEEEDAESSPRYSSPLPSFFIISAPRGVSVRTALPFRRPCELPSQSMSTISSIDDRTILDRNFAQNAPRSIEELLKPRPTSYIGQQGQSGAPAMQKRNIVNVQVSIFEDGMIIALSAPTVVLDAQGAMEIITAWVQIASGGTTVAPLKSLSAPAGFDSPLEQVTQSLVSMTTAEKQALPTPYGWFKYGFWWDVYFRTRTFWSRTITQRRSSFEARDIWIPQKVAEALMQQARSDLQEEGHDVDGEEGGVEMQHVLLAWMLQSLSKGKEWSRTLLSVLVPADLRGLEDEHGRAYIDASCVGVNGNLPTVPVSLVPHSTILAARLGVLALRIRCAQQAQTEASAVAEIICFQIAHSDPILSRRVNKHGVHFFTPNGDWVIFNDWTRTASSSPPVDGTSASRAVSLDFSAMLASPPTQAGQPTKTDFKLPIAAAATLSEPKKGELLHTFTFSGRPSSEASARWSVSLPVPVREAARDASSSASASANTDPASPAGYLASAILPKDARGRHDGFGAGTTVLA